MDKSQTPRHKVRKRHDPKWVGGVLDLSIVQGPFSVAPRQTRISRFATFSPHHGGGAASTAPAPVPSGGAARRGRSGTPCLVRPCSVSSSAAAAASARVLAAASTTAPLCAPPPECAHALSDAGRPYTPLTRPDTGGAKRRVGDAKSLAG
jgi:hypothetical protein